MIDMWVVISKQLEEDENRKILAVEQQQNVAQDDDQDDILNPFIYSLRIYKKLVFLAASGNVTSFFFENLINRERCEKLTDSIRKCMQTVILNEEQFDDDATEQEFKNSLDPTSLKSNYIQLAQRKLILHEQALIYAYGRIGTF